VALNAHFHAVADGRLRYLISLGRIEIDFEGNDLLIPKGADRVPGPLGRLQRRLDLAHFPPLNEDKDAVIIPLDTARGEGRSVNIGKAWDGLHYCLMGRYQARGAPLDFILYRGREFADMGTTPARGFNSKQTQKIQRAYAGVLPTLEARYDARDMVKHGVYPSMGVRKTRDLSVLREQGNALGDFLDHCVETGCGFLTYID